jgi:nucleoside-diphosphate-sugar epimerase
VLPSDDPKEREPSIAKAKTLLGWAPSTKREVGLVKTIEYFRRVLD